MIPSDALLADVATLRAGFTTGELDARELATETLRRIAALDRSGPRLGAVPVIDPGLLLAADALDARPPGERGPLHGIPVTVKDSFAVSGLTVAAGSPAFAKVRARRDAVVVERMRSAGALMVGKTNMPPMAIGGGQPGIYGRTRSPYNPDWLASAWHSGSSIGSGVAVTAGFCTLGIGEETVSSGRSPASNNAVVAYTPSWGVVPSAGNWPLHPFRDVVVPHTRTIADLLTLLEVIAGGHDDDVWTRQRSLDLTGAHTVAAELRGGGLAAVDVTGLRIGVPRLYLGEDYADVRALRLRPSIRALWDRAADLLAEAGATLVPVDFPLVEAYEQRSSAYPGLVEAGYLPADWTAYELGPLVTFGWQRHLDEFCEGRLRLSDVNPYVVRPDPPYALDAIESGRVHPGRDVFDFATIVRDEVPTERQVLARADPALRGLDAARRHLFEDWMHETRLDLLAFPANSDIGPWNADTEPVSARRAWADGCVFSSTNHVVRRVGIPTVTLPMGLMDDTAMPVGLTLAGPAGDDVRLLGIAAAVEALLPPRPMAPLPAIDPRPDLLLDLDPTGRLRHASVLALSTPDHRPSEPR